MATLEDCELCDRPVLELDGQFEILQPYYADSSDPAFKLAGSVHTRCLTSSALGAPWTRWRISHFTSVRGYQVSSEADDWTVLQDRARRALIAFHADGASIAAEHGKVKETPCVGGACLPVERESNITINDPEFVAAVQEELLTKQSMPLSRVVDKLDIREKLQWPQVLDFGEYRFSRQLRNDWSAKSFSALIHYRKLLPDVVLAAWKKL